MGDESRNVKNDTNGQPDNKNHNNMGPCPACGQSGPPDLSGKKKNKCRFCGRRL